MENTNISTKQGNRIKQKASWFCGTTKKLSDIENITKHISEFNYYAYIFHDSDEELAERHIHFIINIVGSRSIKSIAETLGCDYGDVEKLVHVKSYHRYLLHLDSEDKVKYKESDVITNMPDRFSYNLSDRPAQCQNLWADYRKLKSGRISVDEFLDTYKGELSQLNFYQKIRLFGELTRI